MNKKVRELGFLNRDIGIPKGWQSGHAEAISVWSWGRKFESHGGQLSLTLGSLTFKVPELFDVCASWPGHPNKPDPDIRLEKTVTLAALKQAMDPEQS